MKYFFLFLSLVCLSNTSKSQNLTVVGEINYEFEDSGTYRVFGANKINLAWFDYQEGTLFTYDLQTKEVKEKKLSQGRGPSEYLQPTSLYIDKNSTIYLSDFPNSKLIVWNPAEEKFREDIKLNVPPFRITGDNKGIYSFNLNKSDSPIDYLELKTGNSTSFELDGGFFENAKPNEVLFNKDGSLIYFNEQVIHLSKYRTTLTFFSKGNEENLLKVSTDRLAEEQEMEVKQTELADGSVQQILDVTKLLLAHTFAKHPSEDVLLISFEDNRKDSTFDRNAIYY